ncbi:MAG TPA: hypothetical protein VE398_11440, partial [Acidobacteriota bacterium]|nr:hypothetical protein [Acidobacteriota bacterium]
MPRAPGDAGRGALRLDTPVQYVKGIGPRRSEMLAAHGIHSIANLIDYPPFRYEDRTRFQPLASLREGEWVLTRAEVCSIGGFDSGRRRISVFEVLVRDGTGSVRLKFFNQPYLRYVYRAGMRLVVYGQVRRDNYAHGALCFMNPECEILDDDDAGPSVHSGRVVPIYRKLGDLRTRALRQIMYQAVTSLTPDTVDPLPSYLLKQLRLLPRDKALAQLHFPEITSADPEARANQLQRLNEGLSPAHKRMIF